MTPNRSTCESPDRSRSSVPPTDEPGEMKWGFARRLSFVLAYLIFLLPTAVTAATMALIQYTRAYFSQWEKSQTPPGPGQSHSQRKKGTWTH